MSQINYISEEALDAEQSSSQKPLAFEHQIGFPLGSLTDRQFEFLLHDLYKADIEDGTADGFDRVVLMQAVGERGRDCALLSQNTHVGVIQCKKYDGLMTKPGCAREIIKFVLHAIKDPALIPKADGFKYVFAVSNSFNEPAATLLADFNRLIVTDAKLEDWVNEVIAEYESFKGLSYADIRDRLHEVLAAIKVEPLNFNDLNSKLVGRNTIIAKFFTVKKVVAEESLGGIQSALQRILAQQISDEEVSRLASKLQALSPDHRFDTGLVSFWGYPKEFIEALSQEKKLQSHLMSLTVARSQIDAAFMQFLMSRIHDEVFRRITAKGDVSPFTIQAATPYLFGRLGKRLHRALSGDFLSGIATPDKLMGDPLKIKTELLRVGEAVLRNDYSGFAGDAEMVAFKKGLAAHIHAGLPTVEAMSKRFDNEWPKMTTALDEIEAELEKLIPDGPLVVVRGLEWMDDKAHLVKVFTQIAALDKKEAQSKQ